MHFDLILMHVCHGLTGYNRSNEAYDEFVPVNGSLNHSHNQHEGGDQDHHPPGIAKISSRWSVTA